ncbi:hypothetical protein [uncultured Roseobacter sp.]|uniref:hypothetical protein n=1 Tax=uncultured Roseobacter sp. TaxID=114847 RepID=UPI0026319955|nr:hypothetical protein [uncultured Roseobacter sp.]
MRFATLQVFILVALSPVAAGAEVSTAVERARSGAFEESGEVRCSQEVGQSPGTCDANVARSGASAAVVVSFPNGFARTLTFSDRAFLRGNPTMSGVGTDTDWHRSDGVYHIRVDDQRFEIPETLIFKD